MPDGISNEELKLFSLIIQNLGTVIKNSVLYPAVHPISQISIKNFKDSLERWFLQNENLDIGVSPDSILLNGDFLDKKSDIYREVGAHLHSHGVSAISFKKGLVLEELNGMFKFLKEDAKLMREENFSDDDIPSFEHITMKAVDYSVLLESDGGGQISEADGDLWRTLTSVSSESRQGRLPEERESFMRDFLQDSRKSAMVLNKIYRDAVSKLEGDETVVRTRESIARIYDYMSKNPGVLGDSSRTDIGKIISRLDPDFVVKLFSPDTVDGRDFDLSREIMKDVPDEFVAGFMESLVRSSGGFNENLLKIFERISPGGSREGKIASIMAEKLSEPSSVTPEALAEMQMSIKEVFTTHSDSGFMSQMYNLTVDTFIERKAAKMNLPKDLVSMAEVYNREGGETGFKSRESELILNLMWSETDPVDMARLRVKLSDLVPGLFRNKDADRLKDIFLFAFDDMKQKELARPGIKSEMDLLREFLREESVAQLAIKLLAASDEKNADGIVFMLEKIRGPVMLTALLDEFCREEKEGRRNNLTLAMERLSDEDKDLLSERIRFSESRVAGELFAVLKKVDPSRARRFASELISMEDAQVKREIMEDFVPENEEERSIIKGIMKNEKDPGVVRKAVISMLKTGEEDAVGELFDLASRAGGNKELLLEVIEISGELGSEAAVPRLGEILRRRDIFRKNEKIKLAAVVALGRIRSDKAVSVVKEISLTASDEVRGICDMILKLKDSASSQQQKNGDMSDGYEE